MIDGKTSVYGLIGNPVSHSFSPAMQTAAFQASGLNSVYLPFSVEANEIPQLLSAFDLLKIRGFNVTVPHKQTIIPYLDAIAPEALRLGSVNTVIKSKGKWKGYSTDGLGFINALHTDGVQVSKKKIVIYGAGGSCRAIAFSIADRGVSELHVINRTVSKSQDILNEIDLINREIITNTSYQEDDRFDILVNTTSVGMDSDECPVPDEMISRANYIIDIIYSPLETTLLKKAKKFNIPYQNGIEMLIAQGAASFEIWTDKKAPIDVMRDKLLRLISP